MLEHAEGNQTLQHARVGDCMHAGIIKCPADTPLRDVAASMAKHRVHAIAVIGESETRPVAVVSDLDLMQATAVAVEPTAIEVAATEPLAVSAHDSVQRAAQLMSEHAVTHVIVLDAAGGYPVGILSSLDVAAVYAADRG